MKYYGDFLGFRFGSYHSRDLGLYRVSDGDRYNDVSISNFTDTTQKIPGGDGTYYWDSFYSQRTITINTAFDNLSEAQLRQIRQIFNGKAEDWLILDEVPYKKYRVKVQNPPQIKYIAFREDPVVQGIQTVYQRPRVYKGEITFQFISYTPYAIQTSKVAARKLNAIDTSASMRGATLATSITVRSAATSFATTRTLTSGTQVYVPVSSLPSSDGTISVRNCSIYAKATGTGTQPIIEYYVGEKDYIITEITKNGSTYSLKLHNASGNFINSLGDTQSIAYREYEEDAEFDMNKAHETWGELCFPNVDEWHDAVPLLSPLELINLQKDTKISSSSDGGYFVYNPGDAPTDIKIQILREAAPSNLSIYLMHRIQVTGGPASSSINDKALGELHFSNLTVGSNDSTIVVDTATNLVYGAYQNGTQTGTLYNKYISSGDFFKIPVTQVKDTAKSSALTDYCDYLWMNIPPSSAGVYLDYNYLYY